MIEAGRPRCSQRVLAVGGDRGLDLPLERITYDEAMLRYGSDRPDRRIGMRDRGPDRRVRGSEFKVFTGALESGGVVRGLRAGGEFPRSRFDELTEQAQSLGAKGLVWAVVEEDGAWRSPVAKFLSEDEIARRDRRAGGERGRRHAGRGRHAPRWPRACSATCGSRSAEPEPEGARHLLGRRLPDVRVGRGGRALGRRCTIPFTAPDRRPRRRPGHVAQPRATTWSWTAGRSAAARSASTTPSVQQKVFDALGIGPDEAQGALRLPARGARATARRRTAASPSASTGSSRCWPAATRSAT